MRAWEIMTEANRRPIISLRHINALKKLKKARLAKAERHNALVQIMYGGPANELQRIELEQARLELEQKKTELMAAKAEATQANKDALAGMAAAGIDVHQANRDQVSKMAARELGRIDMPERNNRTVGRRCAFT